MSWVRFVLLGGVLAGLLAGQTLLPVGELMRYTLDESSEQLTRGMGAPVQIGDASPGYLTWYYKTDVLDQHDFSHLLMFRREDGKLVSVTRNFHLAVNVDALLPVKSTQTYYWPSETDRQWPVRVRRMGNDRLVIAMGVAKPGEATTQVLIIRRSVLGLFLPWLEQQMAK